MSSTKHKWLNGVLLFALGVNTGFQSAGCLLSERELEKLLEIESRLAAVGVAELFRAG